MTGLFILFGGVALFSAAVYVMDYLARRWKRQEREQQEQHAQRPASAP